MVDFQFLGGMQTNVYLHWSATVDFFFFPLWSIYILNLYHLFFYFYSYFFNIHHFNLPLFFVQDMSQNPPWQELVAKDLHANEWHFRHIFRGVNIVLFARWIRLLLFTNLRNIHYDILYNISFDSWYCLPVNAVV